MQARHARWKASEAARANASSAGATARSPSPDRVPVAAAPLRTDAAASGRATADADRIYPLVGLCRSAGLPEPIPEYQFHKPRRWRFDYCWPLRMVAVEIEGGLWIQGRHSRGKGMLADMEKYNTATMLGYRVLRYAPDQLAHAVRDLRIMFAEEAA